MVTAIPIYAHFRAFCVRVRIVKDRCGRTVLGTCTITRAAVFVGISVGTETNRIDLTLIFRDFDGCIR